MKVSGPALIVGDDINTDVIYPSKYLAVSDRAEQARHAFEGLGNDWPDKVKAHPVLVAGWNFGCGSSREQAATALIAAGVKLVAARSFSRIFMRNCINNGLAVIESNDLVDAAEADKTIEADFVKGEARAGNKTIPFEPLPPNLIAIISDGGLLARLKKA
jgi:3-isopropylmalate/(R)-2-methylmalate dehydratase small subunit